MTTMPFGKYKGRLLRDLPPDYIDWLWNLGDLREPLRSRIWAELGRRRHFDQGQRRGYREPEPERPITGPVDGDLASAIIEAGRRALAQKFHPDKGGDLKIMQSVNATADKLLGQFPRRRRAA